MHRIRVLTPFKPNLTLTKVGSTAQMQYWFHRAALPLTGNTPLLPKDDTETAIIECHFLLCLISTLLFKQKQTATLHIASRKLHHLTYWRVKKFQSRRWVLKRRKNRMLTGIRTPQREGNAMRTNTISSLYRFAIEGENGSWTIFRDTFCESPRQAWH